MNGKIPRENDCKGEAAILDEITSRIFAYGERKRLINAPFREYENYREEWEDYPEGWEDMVLSMLAITAVVGNRKRAAAFVRAEKDQFTEREFQLLKRWRNHPWWYCAFRVIDVREKSFPVIEPLGDPPASWGGDEPPQNMLLYSPNVAKQYRNGKQLFIALVWEGQQAFHTYGMILSFFAIGETDLYFFTDLVRTARRSPQRYPLKGVNDRNQDISDAMMDDTLSFLRLIRISELPRMTSRGGEMLRTASVVSVADVGSLWDEEQWQKACDSAGETLYRAVFKEEAAAVYLGEGSPIYDPTIYLSYHDSRVFLTSMTEEGYERGRAAALPLCAFPETPQLQASMVMYTSAQEFFMYDDELSELEESFGDLPEEQEELEDSIEEDELPEEAGDEDLPTKEELEAISQRIMENHNEGREEDDAEIARSLGVQEQHVAGIRRKLSEVFERMDDEESRAADRYGLSPRAFHELSSQYLPNARGAFRLREAEEIREEAERRGVPLQELLAGCPVFSFASWFLSKALASGSIPATQAGYVTTKLVKEAYEERIIPSPEERFSFLETVETSKAESLRERLKPKKELDWQEFYHLRILLEDADLLIFEGTKYRLAEGAEMLLEQPVALYHHLLRIMFTEHEWNYSRYFGSFPFIRQMAGFLFYAIGKLSQEEGSEASRKEERGWFDGDRLAERFIAAVPPLAEQIEEAPEDEEARLFGPRRFAEHVVQMEFLTFFAERFGLVELEQNGYRLSEYRVRPTLLYEVVFEHGSEASS